MEQNNKLILSNSILLYIRLIVVSIIGLFVTRIILKNLGIHDFGIYTVIGGVVTLVGFINTVMLATSNRFIAYELGVGAINRINKIFNVSLNIHGAIALLALIIGEIVGEWYINNYIKMPPDKLMEAIWVFRFSLSGSVISFIGVPFMGLLLAKEKFLVFCTVDVLISFCKLIFSFCIGYILSNRLVYYAAIMALLTALPTFIYFLYCRRAYFDLVKYRFFKKWTDYKEILNFSVWVGYGAFATVGKNQGATLIINYFFGATLNSALGIASSVNGIIMSFAGNARNAISPQITKSYAAGNAKRTEDLIIAVSKYTFFLLLIPALPIFLEVDYILSIWLVMVPPYTAIFIRLMIIDVLIGALNAGVTDAIFASGNIKWYQLIINTIFLLSLPTAYFLLKMGGEPYTLLYAYIGVSIIALFLRQFLLHLIVKLNTRRLFLHSYIPAFVVTLSLVPTFLLPKISVHPLAVIVLSILFTLFVIFFIGLNKKEKDYALSIIRSAYGRLLLITNKV